jgi:hypothetical protein
VAGVNGLGRLATALDRLEGGGGARASRSPDRARGRGTDLQAREKSLRQGPAARGRRCRDRGTGRVPWCARPRVAFRVGGGAGTRRARAARMRTRRRRGLDRARAPRGLADRIISQSIALADGRAHLPGRVSPDSLTPLSPAMSSVAFWTWMP